MARPRKFEDGGVADPSTGYAGPDQDYGFMGPFEEPQLQRPASETAERERREGLLNPQFNPTPPNPAPDTLRNLQVNPAPPNPAPNPAPNLAAKLRFDPAAAAHSAPVAATGIKAAPAETLGERFRRQSLEAWQNLYRQESQDIFDPEQKPLLDYISEVGKGNVGAWHTVPGRSDLSPPSNDPNSYSIGFDPTSGDRIFSAGQNWFYASSRKRYSGDSVYNKTSIFPQGPAPPDQDSSVQQSYPGTAPAPAPATTPPAAPPTTPKTSFVPRGAGTIDLATPFLGMIDAAAKANGVPPDRLYGHMMAESRGNPNVGSSSAGAQGLMQFMPKTAAALGINPRDPGQAINGAARYLRQLFQRFGDWDKASMAYNAGPGNIARGVVPTETRNYLPIVKRFAAKSPFVQKIGKGLSSLGAGAPAAPPAQPPDLPRAPLPTETTPINQASYSDTLKKLMGMTGLGWAKGGEVHPDAAQDREQMLGILREKKLIKKPGGRAEFAKGGLPDLAEPPKKIPGKEVLRRAPLGHALLPVLHTTIVIGVSPKKGKKKGEKKAEGGRLETAPRFPDAPPRRPQAIPPRRGKAPRGVGQALRGWGKTGR